ncbi:MAG: polymer-forming cytoskeletal protein [Patescibacteria group bacterium]|jgi:cytoskeletal protein CcmA (bactofilin family)
MAKMFASTKEEGTNEINQTIFGESIKIEGTVSGTNNIVIHGDVIGTLKTTGDLFIKDTSTIKANVEANDIVLAGTIHGNVNSTGKLHIHASGKIYGDVTAANIAVETGALIKGQCNVGPDTITANDSAV